MSFQNILVTWDIDGTLILANRSKCHREAFQHALKVLTDGKVDRPISDFVQSIAGWTDVNIATTIIKKATGIDATPEILQKFEDDAVKYFSENFDKSLIVLPGIAKTLEALSKIPNVKIGLCTGNYSEIGKTKLRAAEIYKYFEKDQIAGWGYDKDRANLLKNAISQGEKIIGTKFDHIIHVGDAPTDVQAALDVGVTSVLVKTSWHDFPSFPSPRFELSNLEECFDDFISIVTTGKPINPSLQK